MTKLTKIRSGLYHAEHAGHLIEIERIDEGPADLISMWVFRLDPYGSLEVTTSDPRWTRRETLEVAMRTAETMEVSR